MKSSNKLFFSVLFFCCLMISSFVFAEKIGLEELRNLFGYQFNSKLSFGSVQHFAFEGESALIRINFIPAPSEDMKGKVVDETEKGYELNGHVIRFAKVVVGE